MGLYWAFFVHCINHYKLTNFLETKDWSLVLNTTVGDSYIQDDSDEDIPIHVQDLSIAQVMDLTMRATT